MSSASTYTSKSLNLMATVLLVLGHTTLFFLVTMSMGNTSYSFSLLLMLLAVTATNSYHVDSSLLLRQHYGIVFKPRETFRPIVGHWLHSFGLSLPAYPPVTAEARQLDCQHVSEANRTHCLRMKPYIDSLGLIQRNMSNALRDMMRGIDGIIPERPIPRRRTRVSRSWIPVLGNILHTVAGTATTEKVRKALTAVDEMRRTQAVALNQWAKAEGDIASLTQVVDERMNALQRLVTDEWQSKVRQFTCYQLP